MSAASLTLVVIGSVLVAVGSTLTIWPDIHHWRGPIGEWARRTYGFALSLFGGKPRGRVISVGAAMTAAVGGRGHAIKSLGEGATFEQKVEYLMQRDREAQEAHNVLTDRVADLEGNVVKMVERARVELTRQYEEALVEALTRHRRHRILGWALSIAGGVCLAVATFI